MSSWGVADSRAGQIRKCLAHCKNVLVENPIGMTVEEERSLVALAESTGLITAVNLYLRNSLYH